MTQAKPDLIETRLPAGCTMRPTRFEDVQAVIKLFEQVAAHNKEPFGMLPEELQGNWRTPKFDLARSSRVVVDADGTIIGYITVWDTEDKPVHPWLSLSVLPEYIDGPVGKVLLAWGETRAREAIDRCPPEARVSLRVSAKSGTEKAALLDRIGLQKIRYFHRMLIEMETTPPAPNLPEDIHIRHYRHPDELEKLARADIEGFRDHWGFVEPKFEEWVAEMRHWIESDPLFDETLFFVAIDRSSGQFAGISLCRTEEWSRPEAGYVDSLAVLPAYRKRGLGLALLHHSFGEFWRRGRKTVALHVDTANPTGATRLYERAGMHVDSKNQVYEKELRPGQELSTT